MQKTILKLSNISKSFTGVQALSGVDLEIKEGEIHCLVGENGSRKSTLIKVISGVHQPDSGSIELNGKQHQKLTPAESIREGVQIIYQDFSIFPNLSVAENIAFGVRVAQGKKLVNRKEIRTIAKEITEKIGFQVDLDARVEDLDVASKQLVAICRALANRAKLLIMDEPTTALTRKEVNALFAIVRQLQSDGVSILFVSHKLDEVFELAERFTILRSGKMAVCRETADITQEDFIYYMTGRKLSEEIYALDTSEDRQPLLEVRNLSLPGAYENINFTLYEGEILGITGLLGSGRTELALSLFGALKAEQGEIFIRGEKVRIQSIQDAIHNKIGYVPEDRLSEGLFLPQSIQHNMVLCKLDKLRNRAFCIDKKGINELTDFYIKELGIVANNSKNAAQTLSGGNQQKVVVSRWLSNTPSIMIFNGPTVGVDIAAKFDMHEVMRKLAKQKIGVIIISDDISEVYANCNRIFVMKDGAFIHQLNNTDTTESELSTLMSVG